ncbi:hypothetical protein PRIPAC_79255 [Pristionchus pacificus]|nr:hypothetical protein PRIPAC_79255 [Pristionchus pacificus]
MDDFDYDVSSSTSDGDDYYDYEDELPTWATLFIIFGTMAVCFLLFLLAVGLFKIFCDGPRGGDGGGGVSYTVESGGGGGGGSGHHHHHHHIVRDAFVIEHHHHHHHG